MTLFPVPGAADHDDDALGVAATPSPPREGRGRKQPPARRGGRLFARWQFVGRDGEQLKQYWVPWSKPARYRHLFRIDVLQEPSVQAIMPGAEATRPRRPTTHVASTSMVGGSRL